MTTPRPRYRDLGLTVGLLSPGPLNAITDVAGVSVGMTTLIEGDGPLVVGQGPVRTGVTVVVPHPEITDAPVFAGCHRLNGNGELTGLEWIRESGQLTTPIAITNTHSVGAVRDGLVAADVEAHGRTSAAFWSLPVVGETYDGTLSDINGFHVRTEHVRAALADATGGRVREGNVGGGTGMICHEFKGGTGTASRVNAGWTVGALVQANHGRRPGSPWTAFRLAANWGSTWSLRRGTKRSGSPAPGAVRSSWSWPPTRPSCHINASGWRNARPSASPASAAEANTRVET